MMVDTKELLQVDTMANRDIMTLLPTYNGTIELG